MNLTNDGKVWTWEETLLAFDLYSRIQYGKISPRNEEIIALAELLGRKPGAVSKKMFNIASHDPKQKERGVVALSHTNKFDKQIWEVFENDSNKLAYDARVALSNKKNISLEELVAEDIKEFEYEIFPYGENRERATTTRVGQYFFRMAVLSAYNNKCCITGISDSRLLIASHIKPWRISDDKNEKTNPRNGLCLNPLHDKAFDKGLITISSKDYRIRVSKAMKDVVMDQETYYWFMESEGKQISLPEKFLPGTLFLEYHNDNIFQK